KIFTEYFCRPSIILGPEEWVDKYLRSPELIGIALGAIVNTSSDLSNYYNSGTNAFMAAILADANSGVVPQDSCIELKVQQIGNLIWAPGIPLSKEEQEGIIAWRKFISFG